MFRTGLRSEIFILNARFGLLVSLSICTVLYLSVFANFFGNVRPTENRFFPPAVRNGAISFPLIHLGHAIRSGPHSGPRSCA